MKRIFEFLNNRDKGYNLSFFLFFLNYFNLEIPKEAEPLVEFSYYMFLFSLVALASLINLLITFYILYYVKNTNFEIRLQNNPFILKIIKFYLKTSTITLLVEGIICLSSILIIFTSSIMILNIYFS